MAVRCPVCKQMMVTVPCGPVEIEVCKQGCKGLWFDSFELQQILCNTKAISQALEEALHAPERNRGYEVIKCPVCAISLQVQLYRESPVVVDHCFRCGGFYLDAGELKAICDAHKARIQQSAELKLQHAKAVEPIPASQLFIRGRYSDGTLYDVDEDIDPDFSWTKFVLIWLFCDGIRPRSKGQAWYLPPSMKGRRPRR